MRAVLLSGPLPGTAQTSIGGVAVHTRMLAEELARTGRAVRVLDDSHVAGATPPSVDGVRGAAAARAVALAARRPLTTASVAVRSVASRDRAKLGLPLRTAVVRSLLVASAAERAAQDSVLHIQQADYRPLYADWAGLAMPRLVTVHGLGTLRDPAAPPALAQTVAANLAHARCVVVPSHAVGAEVRDLGVAEDLLRVVPNGVDLDIFRPRDRTGCRHELGIDPDAPLVVYLGRLTAAKGVGDLLAAWPRVTRAVPAATLALVGPALEAFDTAFARGVRVEGAVETADAARWLGASDVAVVPSHYEAFGLTALEAMASARPVVATAVGGLPEVVPDGAGALVDPHDPDALAEALIGMVRDPDAARAAGEAGARAARAYSWEAVARAYGSLYDAL